MQQLAIVHTEQISRKGEIKYFQIPLPGTVKKIIAIEGSVFVFTQASVPQPNPNPVVTPDPIPIPTPTVNNNCPNPGSATIDPVSSITMNDVTTQVFRIGAAVNPGFVYTCGIYAVVISVTAVDGDTPESIAAKLATEVNNTSLATWNQYGNIAQNYKPTAAAYGDELTLDMYYQHQFYASGHGSCTGAAPPPPPPPPSALLQYDPLFFISQNEKAGTLSLQSPDATDIFYQGEVIREDRNINYGDFSFSGELNGEWMKGRKRIATDILITTQSPILEAYYKDVFGEYYNKDMSYQLNIFIWFEKYVHDK